MSRRHAAERRNILPDPRFGDLILAKFINCIMKDGKKSVAESIVYKALEQLSKVSKREPLEAFKESIENLKPTMEVKSRRIGGATYQVPMEVRDVRALALAIRWVIDSAKKRAEKTMRERLASEFLDALNNRGAAIKIKENTHKMAEANRAFAHYKV
jgi:small subunit ribosomal protein S7